MTRLLLHQSSIISLVTYAMTERGRTYGTLRLGQIALVAEDGEGEVEGVAGVGGHQELVLPLLEVLEGLRMERGTERILWHL